MRNASSIRARQRALTRYYLDAGSGGLAVGVHTTQFAIREAGLYRPVLELAARTAAEWARRPVVMIAGVVGRTEQAIQEAQTRARPRLSRGPALARRHEGRERGRADRACAGRRAGNSAGRLLPSARRRRHRAAGVVLAPLRRDRQCRRDQDGAVQPLPHPRRRARRRRGRRGRSRHALHRQRRPHRARSGDALTRSPHNGATVTVRIKGGLLGHWSVWVQKAVELLDRVHAAAAADAVPADLLALDSQVTDCNAAIFDVANDFHGVIAGCHEILRRQGLLEGIWCLDPQETLGPGPEGGDRPGLRRLSASQRRRLRARRIWRAGSHDATP